MPSLDGAAGQELGRCFQVLEECPHVRAQVVSNDDLRPPRKSRGVHPNSRRGLVSGGRAVPLQPP